MKTQSLLLFVILIIGYPVLSSAQEEIRSSQSVDSTKNNFNPQKGKFHVAIQNFVLGSFSNSITNWSFSSRVGYMITNNDMVFLSGRYTGNSGQGHYQSLETSLFYRRYFGKSALKPFVQSGIGMGYAKFSEDSYFENNDEIYGILNVGTGVTLQYKRWGFEVGIQSEYNQNFSGRISLTPLFGISFSF